MLEPKQTVEIEETAGAGLFVEGAEGERNEMPGARAAAEGFRPDPELAERALRRKFTAAYKLRILREAAGATKPGEIAAMLRREGLYTSHLTAWRKQQDAGALAGLQPRKRGPSGPSAEQVEVRTLRARLERISQTPSAEVIDMARRTGLRRLAALIGCVAGAVIAAIILLVGGGPSVASGANTHNGLLKRRSAVDQPASSNVVAGLKRNYPQLQGLLDGHGLAASAIPAPVQRSLAAMASTLVPSLASGSTGEVQAGTAGDFWITTTTSVICGHILQTTAAPATSSQMQGTPGSCDTDSDVLDRGFIEVSSVGGSYTVWGLVPIGDSTVSVSLPSGSSQTLSVTDGAVFGQFSSMPRGVTFTNATGNSITVG